MGIKSGYQPIKTDEKKIFPPNTGSNVKKEPIVIHLKKDTVKEAYYKLLSEYAKLQKSKESMERQFKFELNKSIHDEVLLRGQIEKMKCCGNCKHCKFDMNEESNEYCEKHQQIVNVVTRPCIEWELEEL